MFYCMFYFTCDRSFSAVGWPMMIMRMRDDDDDDVDIGGVYIMSGPRNVTVSDGHTARLDCDVDGFPDDVGVDWLFEGTSVVASSSLHVPVPLEDRRYVVDVHTGSLTVMNVSILDAGRYTCSAYNSVGASATASAYLNVTCTLTHQLVT